jgi:hypothetical protein
MNTRGTVPVDALDQAGQQMRLKPLCIIKHVRLLSLIGFVHPARHHPSNIRHKERNCGKGIGRRTAHLSRWYPGLGSLLGISLRRRSLRKRGTKTMDETFDSTAEKPLPWNHPGDGHLNEIANATCGCKKKFRRRLGERSFVFAHSAAEQPAGKGAKYGRRLIRGFLVVGKTVVIDPGADQTPAHPFKRWLFAGLDVKGTQRPHTEEKETAHPWWKVMCITGVEMFLAVRVTSPP